MASITASRLTREHQAAVRAGMRRTPRLEQGHRVQLEIDDDSVTPRPQRPSDRACPKGLESALFTLDESLILARIGTLAPGDRRAAARPLRSGSAR